MKCDNYWRLSLNGGCARTDEMSDVAPVRDGAHSSFSLGVVNVSLLSASAVSTQA